ncbi:hypothetical protein [Pseudomonas syringae group sp. 247E2]|uniref:hypothetical protein n=1 Tax=Pseudomonas syringae group sp. 247E2 TaxID=3079592 RepID=UPI00290C79F4|nr:hypothetical protein [Pseudomonas syringae group sp. 247E2]MDU8607615.1 hypothetical protein [Pseudomonas syringae group sp. 247E2]
MNILLIEDDDEKLMKITYFVEENFSNSKVSAARSYASGLRKIINLKSTTDIILMDMSMPSYDIAEHEPGGGSPEHFAGRDLLAQMKLRKINVPTVIVTMFDSFGEKGSEKSLSQLTKELKSEYAPPFVGLVYYDSRQEGWQSELKQIIQGTKL